MTVFIGPVYVISPHPGLLVRGNINVAMRPIVRNKDGSISTVRSVGFDLDRSELPRDVQRRFKGRVAQVLVPSVIGFDNLRPANAFGSGLSGYVSTDPNVIWQHFASTGQHLGIFDTVAHSNAYASALHLWQAKFYMTYLAGPLRRRRQKAR
jgi:hypothetical protein